MIAIFIMTLIGATADAAACDEMYHEGHAVVLRLSAGEEWPATW